jgi:hypothetical protein
VRALKRRSYLSKECNGPGNGLSPAAWIRWFTDGERRYGKELWKLASVYLPSSLTSTAYPYRKVWREGLEVAIKIKGS